MQNTLIVANWKSYKTVSESLNWVLEFSQSFREIPGKEIVLCPSFPLLYSLKKILSEKKLQVKLGAQDVSLFPEGAYTGEVNSKQIKELADYVIIGHSERRENFKEDSEILFEKVKRAQEESLTPIFCVQDENTEIPEGNIVIAYEPPSSISTSGPLAEADDPQNANRIALLFKSKKPDSVFLYGGSVSGENARSFTKQEGIGGILVGGKSLSALEFLKIYENS